MLGNRLRRRLLHYIFIGVGSAAVRFDRRYGLAAMFLGYTMAGGRLMEGMMARKSRLTRVAVGIGSAIGRADRGQKGAGEYFQASGRFEAAIAEDCKAVEARAAIGDRGKVLRVPRAAGSMAKAICVDMAFSLAPERNRSPDFTSAENAVLHCLRR